MQAPASDLSGLVAQAVQQAFAALPKTGKPQAHEHTVLAGFVVTRAGSEPRPAVVALGTGTKCLGGGAQSAAAAAAGELLLDGHAEVIARRALMAWVYGELEAAAAAAAMTRAQAAAAGHSGAQDAAAGDGQEPCVCGRAGAAAAAASGGEPRQAAEPQPAFSWCPHSGRFHADPGFELHMYTSQPPCGDGSVFDLGPGSGGACGRSDAGGGRSSAEAGGSGGSGGGGGCEAEAGAGAGQVAAAAATAGARGAATGNTRPAEPEWAPFGRTGAKLIRTGDSSVDRGAAACGSAPSSQQRQSLGAAGGELQQEQGHARPPAPAVPQAWDVERGEQRLGALRRKPGRGDATLSMSCSDKLARWACLGAQGALLGALLAAPLRVATLTVSAPPLLVDGGGGGGGRSGGEAGVDEREPREGGGGAAAAAGGDPGPRAAIRRAVRRAVSERAAGVAQERLRPPFGWRVPAVEVVGPPPEQLGLAPSEERRVPSGFSINWTAAPGQAPCSGHHHHHQQQQQQQQQEQEQQQQPGPTGGPVAHSLPAKRPKAPKGLHEVTLSASGRKAGSVKAPVSAANRSRLCGAELARRFVALRAWAGAQGGGVGCGGPEVSSTSSGSGGGGGGGNAAADRSDAVGGGDPPIGDGAGGACVPSPAALKAALRAEAEAAALGGSGGGSSGSGRPQTYAEAWAELRQPPSLFAAWLEKPLHAAHTASKTPG